MKKEIYKSLSSSACVNITAGAPDSLRIKNETQTSVRVYDKDLIGVAGKLGNVELDALEKEATANLQMGIPYPETHDEVLVKSVDTRKNICDKSQLLKNVKDFTDKLTEQNPDFIFSGKVILNERRASYENSDGTKLDYLGNNIEYSVIFKSKNSANIMDGGIIAEGDKDISSDLLVDVHNQLTAFNNNLPHVDGDSSLVLLDPMYFTFAVQHFVADLYCNGGSLLNGKLGQKVFSDKFSVCCDRNPSRQLCIPFFDVEGTVNDDNKTYLVKNGVMQKLLGTKSNAKKYNIENFGNSSAEYASVPVPSIAGFTTDRNFNCIEDALKGKQAIYIAETSGGDMTPDGIISLPVQVAYLYKDGKLVGKLPEFSVSANLFEMFGDDLVGVVKNTINKTSRENILITKMNLVNKK